MTATIQWHESKDGRRSFLEARDEYGAGCGVVENMPPITAATDSHHVVSLFDFPATVLSVDHDGEFIHVTFAD